MDNKADEEVVVGSSVSPSVDVEERERFARLGIVGGAEPKTFTSSSADIQVKR